MPGRRLRADPGDRVCAGSETDAAAPADAAVPAAARGGAGAGGRSGGPRRSSARTGLGAGLAVLGMSLVGCGMLGGGGADPGGPPVQAGAGQGGGASATPTSAGAPATSSAAAVPPGTVNRTPTGQPVTLAFAGDVHFAGVSQSALSSFGPISAVLSRADLAVLNLETAVTNGGTPAAKTYTFRAPPQAFTALRSAGVDVATLANNHGMDYGLVGLQDTLRYAQQANFPVIGIGADDTAAFAPYRATINGQRIVVIGATRVLDDQLAAAWTAGPGKPGMASGKDVSRLVAAVRAARATADTVVVFLHWGVERRTCPGADQTELVPLLAAAGADVIVGSHAHVLEGSGWDSSGAYVDYGLGNFVFYASGGGPATESGVLQLTVRGRAVTGADWVPARIVSGRPQPLSGTAATTAIAAQAALRGCTGLSATPPQ
jgi:poly-gamma-glutamate synthesis protein (capsule biosynthesis protein)